MSRMRFFDLDNRSVGEIACSVSRTWAVNYSKSESGQSTTVVIHSKKAVREWCGPGRMALVEDPRFPAFAGMFDPPWSAIAPVTSALYNPEYLLSLRTPSQRQKFTGSTEEIVRQILDVANGQEELFLRLGECDFTDDDREETLDTRNLWDQLLGLIRRVGAEMLIRPVVVDGQLILYMDVLQRVGVNTGFLLHDGARANMKILRAEIAKTVINQVVGTSSQSTAQSRITTEPFTDDESADEYRLRSAVVQFRDVVEQGTLERHTEAYLESAARQRLELEIALYDVGDTFSQARPGNTYMLQASSILLPRRAPGWRGSGRIMKMTYNEPEGSLTATVEVVL